MNSQKFAEILERHGAGLEPAAGSNPTYLTFL
jgi:hypothetical protein